MRRNRDPLRRILRRMLFGQRRVFMVALLVCLALSAMLGRRLVIIPHLYGRNLRADLHLPAMESPRAGEKVVIFSPHPDDETLGCGGYIQQAVAAGTEVRVVLMTNGEYPEFDLSRLERNVGSEKDSFVRLGLARQMESISALGYLGLPSSNVIFLGYPNRYLDDICLPAHWTPCTPIRSARTRSTCSPFANSMTGRAVYCGESALQDVETILLHERPDVVFTLHPNDVHPDHWPTYTLVRFALNELAARGEEFAARCRVYMYLIHRDSWPAPRSYRPTQKMEPPASLALIRQTEWLSLPLTGEETQRKHKATGHYRTQAGRIDPLLRSFSRASELYGTIDQEAWPDVETVEPRVVIVDPDADLVTSAANKQGDISTVYLGRANGRMNLRVITRGKASSKTVYHASLHAGSAYARDRVILQCDWQGTKASGWMLREGSVKKLASGKASSVHDDNSSTLDAPWPFDSETPTFFMVRVWTTQRGRIVDQTGTTSFLIAPPGAE